MCRKSVILISSLITIYFLNSINAFELNRIQIFENDFEEERELSSINVQNFSMINNFREFFKENEKSDDKDSNKLCDFHLNKTFEGIKNLETWALELIDSWGKIPTGILWGHFADLGNFDECVNLTKTFTNNEENQNQKPMKGKYCLASIPIDEKLSSVINGKIVKSFHPLENRRHPDLRMIPVPGTGLPIRIGICIPDSCKEEYMNKKIQEFLKEQFGLVFNKTILTDDVCTTEYAFEYRTIDIIAIVIFSIIGVIMLLSSIYDYVKDKIGGPKKQLFIAFSVFTNGKKLFKMADNSKSTNVIECLNGIRCLSIIWVVYGHEHMSAYLPMINTKYIFTWLQTFYSMLIQSATVSVDSFFLLSGLLIAWIVLKELDKSNGKLNVPLMYFHRYLRLTPVLGFAILFSASLYRHLGNGPFWKSTMTMASPACEKYWWSTLLYIQNYVNPDNICVPHSWYLSVDTQLYIISPLLLIPLWKWGKKFIWVPIILALASISACFAITYIHGFSLLYVNVDTFVSQDKMKLTYYVTHTRIAPWIVGLLLGYYFHLNRNKQIKISKLILILGWLCSFTILLAVIFGYHGRLPPNPKATAIESAFYESCSRVSWAIALAWIIFACHNGYGGIINEFLSLPFWQPFSRLTYCIYITHFFVITYLVATTKTSIHFSTFEFIVRFFASFGITLVISVICVLAFESPIIGIEKCIFRQSKNSSKSNQQVTTTSQDPLCGNKNGEINA